MSSEQTVNSTADRIFNIPVRTEAYTSRQILYSSIPFNLILM
jgi:hypothetical protein